MSFPAAILFLMAAHVSPVRREPGTGPLPKASSRCPRRAAAGRGSGRYFREPVSRSLFQPSTSWASGPENA
ncbi:hypothetical protein DESPIG_02358 [Desulfovibrio piger ATCC 29098]|uniref:Uncharacterized protein n=1 Tax=Desulfovibrio piger ATCC 29098 TaxID=411464 RepID=B6WW90_9BACT|nr:hypothetical protein DESPIG_02358 [Desulfovibrio piger ATCC 29098]